MTLSSKSVVALCIGASVLSSAVAVGVSNVLVTKTLADQLPQAIDQVMSDKETKAVAERSQKILAPWTKAAKNAPQGRRIYGDLNAQFTLVEYSDLECPFCKRFHDTPKQLVDQAGGRINWEWQHYPLQFHNPAAASAAHAAECVSETAGSKGFWAFLHEWFDRSQMNGQGFADMELLAREVGARPDDFRACMDSGKYKEKIQKEMDRGTALGVTGTPATVVVDNETGKSVLVKGAQPPQAILEAMSQLMAQRNNNSPTQGEADDGK